MAGHNKWSQIKRQKGAEDAKKAKVFSVFAKIIAMESKKAKGNLSSPGLQSAIEKAKKANVPNENIDRAVKRGMGADAPTLEEFLFEGYGPGGVAILVEGLTDNKNRTLNELKHIFTKNGATPGTPGSALWAFQKTEEGWKATSPLEVPDTDAEALGALVDELENHEDAKGVYTTGAE